MRFQIIRIEAMMGQCHDVRREILIEYLMNGIVSQRI